MASSKKTTLANKVSPKTRRLLIAAWVVGLSSSLVMGYFEYFAFRDDVDYSHTSLIGYPGYCLAMVITTLLAIAYARKARGKTWTIATTLLVLWTIVSILSTVLVKNSTS